MTKIKTVLGNISESDIGTVLPHEHICCCSEYLYRMSGEKYLDKDKLLACSVSYLKAIKEKYNLSTFIDCTPVNIGRDIELLKKVSEQSGVNIICSTGFYYTEESVLFNTSAENLSEHIIADAVNVNAGIIKCAVEYENISPFNEKILRACAKAQLELNLPIVMHSNAKNKNGIKALEIILSEGVKPQAVTVSHLSDTQDIEYIKFFAKRGCYIGLDRMYGNFSDEYFESKIHTITELADAGYADKILLSHDALFFNGFQETPKINETPRFNYCFDYILPKLSKGLAEKITEENPLKMLKVI